MFFFINRRKMNDDCIPNELKLINITIKEISEEAAI